MMSVKSKQKNNSKQFYMEKKRNLWVIPTDKPTWLHKSTLTGVLRKSSSCIDDMKQAQGMNIYITSNEEIEEGDWFLDDNNSIGQSYKLSHVQFANPKKIILTTDQDLIDDGIQAIPDEFLEWFVKNPSCESVEVLEAPKLVKMIDNEFYKIIIPKEEAKQEIPPLGKWCAKSNKFLL